MRFCEFNCLFTFSFEFRVLVWFSWPGIELLIWLPEGVGAAAAGVRRAGDSLSKADLLPCPPWLPWTSGAVLASSRLLRSWSVVGRLLWGAMAAGGGPAGVLERAPVEGLTNATGGGDWLLTGFGYEPGRGGGPVPGPMQS